MTTRLRMWIMALTLAAFFGLVSFNGTSHGQEKNAGKTIDLVVIDIAREIKKGNQADAKKIACDDAKKLAKISDLMQLFKTRSKGGLGAGPTELANPSRDGIDAMIRELARAVPTGIGAQADSLEEMGYWISSMGEYSKAAVAKAPMNGKKRNPKAWLDLSEEMRDVGVEFAKAAATKNAKQIQDAAAKVKSNCSRCHTIFKDM